MNVLFATDGSESATQAQNLVASISWPVSTRIEVLHVAQSFAADLGPEGQYSTAPDELRRSTERALSATKGVLNTSGRKVVTAVIVGRPASLIVDEARALPADLVVLGSHGCGAPGAEVLGSVAAETVDHAPCPVLVARSETMTGVVLAHDGSAGARQAEAVVLALPFLRSLPVRVVSACVAPTCLADDPADGTFPTAGHIVQLTNDSRDRFASVAADAAARLNRAGVRAVAEVVEPPAAEAVASSARPTDLIVMGTRGHTGLSRLLLGSVARGVLHRAHSSVLFVPQPASPPENVTRDAPWERWR